LAHWIGVKGWVTLAKNIAKTPPFVTSPQKAPHPKRKTFFSVSTRTLAESVEGLKSSVAQSAGELWS